MRRSFHSSYEQEGIAYGSMVPLEKNNELRILALVFMRSDYHADLINFFSTSNTMSDLRNLLELLRIEKLGLRMMKISMPVISISRGGK